MQNNDPQAPAVDAAADAAVAADIDALRARVAELEAGNAELRDAVLREKADIENQRRRLHRDLEQARRFANEKLLSELLPVFDGLESGLAVETADVAAMREGLSLTLKALLKVGENHGLAQVNPIGQPLDPERHHAVSMVAAADAAPGTVVSVLQKGYLLNERLLRPALVSVAQE
ncbi:MAG: nucleotide exchange factor GrpE [Rhodanobacter sp.]|nr:MAG: nucleotide exchange factor GrpE [Rhodanobacter sp.]TAM09979.1 MAG: nucleotide exchange factor GrpE [Rhodanobacter sp.]TAM34674.1 MAG: nucleotide exchange factor GrpE [Rhodanobacter sp.]